MSWIKWIESTRLVTAEPDESVRTAVARMAAEDIGAILVLRDGKLEGIFSERDLLKRVVGMGLDPDSTAVGEVCTRNPKVVLESAELGECARLVKEHGFRHVPVVDALGRPVGVISVRDFLRHATDELETLVARAYGEKRREQMVDPYDLMGPAPEA